MLSTTSRRLLFFLGGGLEGPFQATRVALAPKQKGGGGGRGDNKNSTNTNGASGNRTTSAVSKGAASELHSAAKLRERSRRSSSSSSPPQQQKKKASSPSSSLGRPLMNPKLKRHVETSRSQRGSALAPLKKLSDGEMDSLESINEKVRGHQQKVMQKVALNLNSFLATAGTSTPSTTAGSKVINTKSGDAENRTAGDEVYEDADGFERDPHFGAEKEEVGGGGVSLTSSSPTSITAMSGAQAAFYAQSQANTTMVNRPKTSTTSSSASLPNSAANVFVPYVTPEDAAMFDDGTVDPSMLLNKGVGGAGRSMASGRRGGSADDEVGEDSSVVISKAGKTFDFTRINVMNRMGDNLKGKGRKMAASSSTPNSSSSSAGSSDHHVALGGNSQIIIDDGSGELGASHLVFSPLNNRLLQRDSPVVQSLLEIGFEINEQSKELYLKHPDVLNEYAHAVRYGGIELPRCWKSKMVTEVGYLLQNPRIDDPASHLNKLMENRKASRRANIGMIASVEAGGASAAERAAQEDSANANIVLNKEQREVLDWALKGYCMYIGGSAGTGKTVLLTALKRRLTQEGLRVAMTATTGIAGCHIGGATFHHTFSVTATEEFANKKNLLSYDVVIIDEVSMMSRKLFEEFDDALRHEAGINIPFGGVQIILCGDFLQLSPVNEESIIESPLFTENFVLARLIQQVRQSQFPEFAKMLGEIRHGTCPPLLQQAIKALPEGTMAPDAINLLPTNIQVREANQKELERIEAPSFKLTPRVSEVKLDGEFTPTILLHIDSADRFNATKLLMLAYDFIRQRVQLRNPRGFSLYRLFSDGYAFRICLPQAESALWKRTLVARFLEIPPMIEKWNLGCSVHNIVKDGVGLHTAEFEEGLSRLLKNHPVVQPQELKEGCRVLLRSNLTTTLVNGSVGVVKGFCPCEKEYVHSYLRADSAVDSLIEEYNNYHLVELGYPATLPLVQFAEGMPPIAIPPQSVTIGGTSATQYYALEGIAVPLTLAYAFTVHKVQGLTLVGRVHLELSKMWPCNHLLYVAMSRVKNPDQLSVSGFDPSMIVADPKAVVFDEALMSKERIEIPPTATVAVWKGFDTYSVTQDFHKSIGGEAASGGGGVSSSAFHGSKGANAIMAAEAEKKQAAEDATSSASSLSKKKAGGKGATSAVGRLKMEKDNAKFVAMHTNNADAPEEGSSMDAPIADESVFVPPPTATEGGDSSSDAFASKSKPATHHELLFQQMAQRGAGNYKYFTGEMGGRKTMGGSSASMAAQQKKQAFEEAKPHFISATSSAHSLSNMGVRGAATIQYSKQQQQAGDGASATQQQEQAEYYEEPTGGDDMPPL